MSHFRGEVEILYIIIWSVFSPRKEMRKTIYELDILLFSWAAHRDRNGWNQRVQVIDVFLF